MPGDRRMRLGKREVIVEQSSRYSEGKSTVLHPVGVVFSPYRYIATLEDEAIDAGVGGFPELDTEVSADRDRVRVEVWLYALRFAQ